MVRWTAIWRGTTRATHRVIVTGTSSATDTGTPGSARRSRPPYLGRSSRGLVPPAARRHTRRWSPGCFPRVPPPHTGAGSHFIWRSDTLFGGAQEQVVTGIDLHAVPRRPSRTYEPHKARRAPRRRRSRSSQESIARVPRGRSDTYEPGKVPRVLRSRRNMW